MVENEKILRKEWNKTGLSSYLDFGGDLLLERLADLLLDLLGLLLGLLERDPGLLLPTGLLERDRE